MKSKERDNTKDAILTRSDAQLEFFAFGRISVGKYNVCNNVLVSDTSDAALLRCLGT